MCIGILRAWVRHMVDFSSVLLESLCRLRWTVPCSSFRGAALHESILTRSLKWFPSCLLGKIKALKIWNSSLQASKGKKLIHSYPPLYSPRKRLSFPWILIYLLALIAIDQIPTQQATTKHASAKAVVLTYEQARDWATDARKTSCVSNTQ
jgi:hypothetical protein